MDKNRFYLIILLAFTIILFLLKYYQDLKKEIFNENKNLTKLETKIDKILYLQKLYDSKKITRRIARFKECKIKDSNNLKLFCENLSKQQFKTLSNLIFSSNLDISKFKIEKNNKISLYVEINK